uniref:Uncharacterized protein n=1 Tax=Knipowitschia caucasica TaxID=637954 RepID=A0AAV2LA95_KNICA
MPVIYEDHSESGGEVVVRVGWGGEVGPVLRHLGLPRGSPGPAEPCACQGKHVWPFNNRSTCENRTTDHVSEQINSPRCGEGQAPLTDRSRSAAPSEPSEPSDTFTMGRETEKLREYGASDGNGNIQECPFCSL